MKNVKHSFGYWVDGFSDDPDDVARHVQATAYENSLYRNAQNLLDALKGAIADRCDTEVRTSFDDYVDRLIKEIEDAKELQ